MTDLVAVRSSNILAIGYDREPQTLTVQFANGRLYEFLNVPDTVHFALMNATSIGKAFFAEIRGRYETREVTVTLTDADVDAILQQKPTGD